MNIILKRIFTKRDGTVWTGLAWLRIRTDAGLLCTWWWTYGFNKVLEISWPSEELSAFQEGHCFVEWVHSWAHYISYQNSCVILECFPIRSPTFPSASFYAVRQICEKKNISYVMSIRPSVRPHGTTRLPLDESSWFWYWRIFRKSV